MRTNITKKTTKNWEIKINEKLAFMKILGHLGSVYNEGTVKVLKIFILLV